jgi:transglutaminase-like putative cysteine protease
MSEQCVKGGLGATPVIDADHPAVIAFARETTEGCATDRERAVRLYYRVRDGIRYDPYRLDFTIPGLRASTTLARGYGWCVPKAVLLAAGCRALGIPARLGFADVRNHLSTERMRREMKTDIFYWHGYTAIFLGGRWLKATPAFNIELCRKFRLRPLEFDGERDAIFHPFDLLGRRHMEYVNYRGEFDDLPLEAMLATFRRHYRFMDEAYDPDAADFAADVERETRG